MSMIDFAEINDPLERTQTLPVLTVEGQLEDALLRERAARIEASELFCQNADLVKELARLRYIARDGLSNPAMLAPAAQRHEDTEQTLFEVCGALKLTLSRVLAECQMRDLSLTCGPAASRTLHEACDKLERALSAPETCSAAPPMVVTASPVAASGDEVRAARVVSLALVRPDAHPEDPASAPSDSRPLCSASATAHARATPERTHEDQLA